MIQVWLALTRVNLWNKFASDALIERDYIEDKRGQNYSDSLCETFMLQRKN